MDGAGAAAGVGGRAKEAQNRHKPISRQRLPNFERTARGLRAPPTLILGYDLHQQFGHGPAHR